LKADPPNLIAVDHRSLTAPRSSAGVHILALLTCIATFPLIFMGGLVTSHHAGMSVPDWPNSYGYNMFLFPPSHWVGGIVYEHTHRLMGTIVGMLAIATALWAWKPQIIRMAISKNDAAGSLRIASEPHRYLALAVLGGVIFQGVLGGLRVVLVKLDLAIVHACVAQAFFCLSAYLALVTSANWEQSTNASIARRGLFWLGVATVTAIYLQFIVGATMRHYDAGLAIPDLPLAYGKLLPPMTSAALADVNHLRAFKLNLDPVTMTQVWLHFGHRIGALLVTVLTVSWALLAIRRGSKLRTNGSILLALLAIQLTLGVLTVLLRKPADVASSHVAVGALVLLTSFILTVKASRIPQKS
jgi:cytochrome c oxidase assembly protein subunit 15